MNANGNPVNLIFKKKGTNEQVTVDPSCLNLEWRISNAVNAVLEVDNVLSPTCITIP